MELKIKRFISAFLLGITVIVIFPFLNGNITGSNIMSWFTGYTYLGNQNIVLQKDKSDCGPAALLNIFHHYEIESTLEEIMQIAGTTEKGTSMLGLKMMAEINGLNADGWKLAWNDFNQIALPAIAFVRGNHYVVIKEFMNNGNLLLIDPALGMLEMNEKKFKKIWQGETLIFRVSAKTTERVLSNPLADTKVIGGSCRDEHR